MYFIIWTQATFASLSHLWMDHQQVPTHNPRRRVRDTAIISPAYLLLAVRQRHLRYLGHLLRLPHDSVVRRTLMAMTGGGNHYTEWSLFMDCQGSELKDLETLAKNHTA